MLFFCALVASILLPSANAYGAMGQYDAEDVMGTARRSRLCAVGERMACPEGFALANNPEKGRAPVCVVSVELFDDDLGSGAEQAATTPAICVPVGSGFAPTDRPGKRSKGGGNGRASFDGSGDAPMDRRHDAIKNSHNNGEKRSGKARKGGWNPGSGFAPTKGGKIAKHSKGRGADGPFGGSGDTPMSSMKGSKAEKSDRNHGSGFARARGGYTGKADRTRPDHAGAFEEAAFQQHREHQQQHRQTVPAGKAGKGSGTDRASGAVTGATHEVEAQSSSLPPVSSSPTQSESESPRLTAFTAAAAGLAVVVLLVVAAVAFRKRKNGAAAVKATIPAYNSGDVINLRTGLDNPLYDDAKKTTLA